LEMKRQATRFAGMRIWQVIDVLSCDEEARQGLCLVLWFNLFIFYFK
jgi:hypothetical protein